LEKEKPDWLVVYGDTNSTLAAAIAGSKIHVPVAHIEAGLRSYNKQMPEEINRILCDHVSTMLFSPTLAGFENLKKEGFKINQAPFTFDNPGIFHCGDLMYDNSLYFASQAESLTNIAQQLQLKDSKYILATIHRNNNTDDPERLNTLLETLSDVASENNLRVILPLHPRTKNLLENNNIKMDSSIIDPVGYFDMLMLLKNCQMVITDSGGLQKEAFFFRKYCITIREQTEWIELVSHGYNYIAGTDSDYIVRLYNGLADKDYPDIVNLYGNGQAALNICRALSE
jgi:UDP-GlcNAc3NAcA epimerase